MARDLFCAGCGEQLTITKKALPSKGIVVDLLTPHECNTVDKIDLDGEEDIVVERAEPKPEEKKKVDELFDSFNFVKKLNKEEEEKKVVFDKSDPGDRRGKEHLREEIQTSTAPEGIRRNTPGVSKDLGDDPRTIAIEE